MSLGKPDASPAQSIALSVPKFKFQSAGYFKRQREKCFGACSTQDQKEFNADIGKIALCVQKVF